jgi:hypothetical protein
MLSAAHISLLEERGVDIEVATNLGWHTLDDKPSFIGIPFFRDGKKIGEKFRTLGKEKKFFQEKGGEQCFYNLDVFAEVKHFTPHERTITEIIITEGEMDCIIATQCGYRAVSVPSGANEKPVEGEDSAKFEFLTDFPHLCVAVLATDNDAPGHVLRQDLGLRLGWHRCKWVQYPKGCKDLNEVYTKFGKKGVDKVLKEKTRFMNEGGLFQFNDLPEEPPMPGFDPMIDGVSGNIIVRQGDFWIVTGIPNMGKALALDTPIPTPYGWSTMGELKIGDKVFDEKGSICNVTSVTGIMLNRDCYEVEFTNGEKIVADGSHQWFTLSEKARRSELQSKNKRNGRENLKPHGSDQRHKKTYAAIVTTQEISKTVYSQGKLNHHISLCKGIELPGRQLPIDPYVLGCWLGDGHSSCGRIAIGDQSLCIFIEESGYKISHGHGGGISRTIFGIQPILRSLMLINNKHIPKEYLRSSYQQRLSLLQGLMDTDGCCDKLGYCEFCNINEALAKQVHELVLSLGIKASISVGNATLYGRITSKKYRVIFHTSVPIFRLARKLERLPYKIHRNNNHRIVSCKKVKSVPVRCIQVDSLNSLYLCSRSFIPTHNSTFVNALAANMAHFYAWNICIASFETHPRRGIAKFMRTYFLEKPQFSTEGFNQWGGDDVAAADEWINRRFFFIMQDVTSDDLITLSWLLSRVKAAITQYNVKMVIIDPWNEIDHDRPGGMTLTEYIGVAIKEFKRIAQRYMVTIIIVAHPSKLVKNKDGIYDPPTMYDISDSSHWKNKSDIGVIVHMLNGEDGAKATLVRTEKVREWGVMGIVGDCRLHYDPHTSRYSEAHNFIEKQSRKTERKKKEKEPENDAIPPVQDIQPNLPYKD